MVYSYIHTLRMESKTEHALHRLIGIVKCEHAPPMASCHPPGHFYVAHFTSILWSLVLLLCVAYHHHQPVYAQCSAKASPVSLQSTRSCAKCSHVIPVNFLISPAHLAALWHIRPLYKSSLLPLMTSGCLDQQSLEEMVASHISRKFLS